MDEKYTREKKKSTGRSAETEKQKVKIQKSYASKLRGELSKREAVRKKLRVGKADTTESLQERRKRTKLHRQSKKKIYTDMASVSKNWNQTTVQSEDTNASEDIIHETLSTAYMISDMESDIYAKKMKYHDKQEQGYGKKLQKKRYLEETSTQQLQKDNAALSETAAKQAQKNFMKKEMQKEAYRKQAKETSNQVGSFARKYVDKAEDLVGRLAEFVREYLEEHPLGVVIAVLVLVIALVISGTFSSCAVVGGSSQNIMLGTSYTAQDPDIIEVNDDYKELEEELQEVIDNIETDFPGYDEYNYTLEEIGHNPYELAALLTVLYEDYTPGEVQEMLKTIMDAQYILEMEEAIEQRTRMVTQIDPDTGEEIEVEETYDYYILNITLTNFSVDYVARNMNLNEDQLMRYDVLLETYGNKKYLFEDDPNAIVTPSEYPDYRVPSEYLTDQEFAKLLAEAEKYLDMAYVWGGSSPSTGFDCSGFVSYVINNSGNGWDVGRQTANGLLNNCARISKNNAKPGDLIFFQGTYNIPGASHVGIYVGDGMMIHCGNPVKYSSINTNYWQEHFYTFGRLDH